MRIVTVNLNGIRSAAGKGFYEWLAQQEAAILVLPEINGQEAGRSGAAVRAQITPLGIELGDTQAGDDLLRPLAAIDAHTAVAFLFRIMKVAVITVWREHLPGHVRFLRLDFLQANDVGILLREPFVEAFACG